MFFCLYVFVVVLIRVRMCFFFSFLMFVSVFVVFLVLMFVVECGACWVDELVDVSVFVYEEFVM